MKLFALIASMFFIGAANARPVLMNGGFDAPVPSHGEGNGWRALNNDVNGGWRDAGGNPGGNFILNSSGDASTDPTIQQRVDGLYTGASYQILGNYSSAIHTDRPAGIAAFVVDVSTTDKGPWTTVFTGGSTAVGIWTPFATQRFSAKASSMWIRLRAETQSSDNDFRVDNIQMIAHEGVSFPGTTASGFSTGEASCKYPQVDSSFFHQTGSINFAFSSGHGGTSGGLVGWVHDAGWAGLSIDGDIAHPRPGHTEMRFTVGGGAYLFQPYNFVGRCTATVSLDSPLYIDVADSPSGMPYYVSIQKSGAFSTAALRRVVDGAEFANGGFVPPGTYLLLESASISVTATNDKIYDHADDYIIATFVSQPCTPPAAIPVIISSPDRVETCPGGSAVLNISAAGTNLTYQWRVNGEELRDDSAYSGANTPTLRISAVPGNAHRYDCVVTNQCGSIRSAAATVHRVPVPTVVWDDFSYSPFPLRICGVGSTGTVMTVHGHTGTSRSVARPISFQWYRGDTPLVDGPTPFGSTITGSQSGSLSIYPLTPYDGGNRPEQRYRCLVSNECGSNTSHWGWINYCPVDVDCSYVVDSADFFAFLGFFFDNMSQADINQDAMINSQDFFVFLEFFFRSCDE